MADEEQPANDTGAMVDLVSRRVRAAAEAIDGEPITNPLVQRALLAWLEYRREKYGHDWRSAPSPSVRAQSQAGMRLRKPASFRRLSQELASVPEVVDRIARVWMEWIYDPDPRAARRCLEWWMQYVSPQLARMEVQADGGGDAGLAYAMMASLARQAHGLAEARIVIDVTPEDGATEDPPLPQGETATAGSGSRE